MHEVHWSGFKMTGWMLLKTSFSDLYVGLLMCLLNWKCKRKTFNQVASAGKFIEFTLESVIRVKNYEMRLGTDIPHLMHWNAITTFNSINMFEKSFDRQRGATLYKVYIKNSTVQCKSYRGSALIWFWAFIDSSAMATQRPQGHKARIVAFSDTSYFYSLLKITLKQE